ncbi:MAG TPA: hypothetical protein VG297_09910 [Bryobacteraceae bacterium]|jgi:hypothetical protein|nr:hypothetical protein [Bryobacteraceae bacterium]
MSTEKQIAANRLNALKSTGPRTPEGKAISSRNAVRHDLLDKRFILAGECPDAYDAFAQTFYDEYRPATATETALVDIMAAARWRLIRLANIDAGLIDHEYTAPAGPETATLPVTARVTLAYRQAASSGRTVETTSRAEARLLLQFNGALDRLDRLRRQRRKIRRKSRSVRALQRKDGEK